MLPQIILLPLDRSNFRSNPLALLLNRFWNMSPPSNPAYLRHMLKLFLQMLIILQLLFLPRRPYGRPIGRIRPP